MSDQHGLFGSAKPSLPEGFRYQPDLVTRDEETSLIAKIRDLPFKEFDFHGFKGKRRVVSFGWRYDFGDEKLNKANDIPGFLLPVRAAAAEFAGLRPNDLQHMLVTEYREGAGIGWHRDKAVFGDVIGISLLSPCVFRLRLRDGKSFKRASITAEPRSVYLMRGESRTRWEHSIPGVDALRYSITLRNLKER